MTPEEAFLQAVIESPDDDGPRLMYADWLEERGDPRGEFIRVQLELVRLPEGDDRRAELATRERLLLASHGKEWLAPLHPLVVNCRFRRGFPEWVTIVDLPQLTFRQWCQSFERLFDASPVRGIDLGPCCTSAEDARLPWLARSPLLRRLTDLAVGCDLEWFADLYRTTLTHLAASPHAVALESLDLSRRVVEGHELETLAASPNLPRLQRLNLALTDLTAGTLSRLARSPMAARLTHFDCSRNPRLNAFDLRALLDAPAVSRLSHLTFGADGFGESGVQPLLGSPLILGQLVSLRCCGHHEGRDIVQAVPALSVLLGLRSLVRLRELTLEGVRVGQVGLQKFLEGSAARVLLSLRLDRCCLDDQTVPQLQALLNGGRLRRLALPWNYLTDKGAVALARCPGLARLHELDLRGNDLTPAGRNAIETSPHRHRWLHLLT